MFAAIMLRIGLLVYGEWQDRNFSIKFTDVDYFVFSDAAEAIVRGGSPFERTTYRYSPLVAWILLPNHYVGMLFGKVLFSIADLFVGWLIFGILSIRGVSESSALGCAAAWWFNPLVLAVSTRGNLESVLCFVILAAFYLLLKRRVHAAAFCYGLAVHLKLYPIVYSLPIFLWLSSEAFRGPRPTRISRLAHFLKSPGILFGIESALTFFILTLLMYFWFVCSVDCLLPLFN